MKMNKLKIGIYEASTSHLIFLYYLIKMMKLLKNVEIYLFISEYMLANLPKLDKHILEGTILYVLRYRFPEKTLFYVIKNRFLKLIYNCHVSRISHKLDIFIANSLGGGRLNLFSYPFLRPQCNYILVESLYGDPYLRVFNKFNWDKLSNYLAYKISQWQIDKANKLIFHSRDVIGKVKHYTDKPIMFMPFNFYEERDPAKKINNKEKIIFTVSGGIEKRRKNYAFFFQALKILLENDPGLKEKISVVFLGTIKRKNNAFGISIIEDVKKFNHKFGNIIRYYEELFISEDEYRKKIEETDILINPLNVNYYKFDVFTSGLGEAISYSIPGIYPEGFKTMRELTSSSLFFHDSRTLADLMKEIIVEPDFLRELKINAAINSRKVMLDDYAVKLYNFLLEP